MPFVIFTADKPNARPIRVAHLQAHMDYLNGFIGKLLASGATFDEEFDRPVGSCIVIDVATREQAQAFVDGDPFHKAGLAQTVSIVPWKASYLDGKRVSAPSR